MDFLVISIGIISIIGIVISLYEWRKKRVLLKHDMNLAVTGQTEAGRELHRSTAAMRYKIVFVQLQ
jgi:hypothetical protein